MRRFSRSQLTKQQIILKEQLGICIRWDDDCLVIHEDSIEMHLLERTNAYQAVAIIKVTPY